MRIQIPIFSCIAALAMQSAVAQNYPAKPIRILIAQAPGSATDNVSRVLSGKLAEQLGQPFVIEARPGAGGAIGTEAAARSPADGYTLFMANNSTHGSNPAVYKKLPYDAVKDFSPIILIASTPYVLTAHPSLPVKSVKELIAFAKKRPGELNYGSAGNGSTHHLSGELLKTMAGINLVHVPYKGTTPALTGLLSGEVSVVFFTVVGVQPHVKSGKARALAVTTPTRSNMMPELPTMAEAGLKGFEVSSWFGLLAPAGTPAAIVSRLNAESVKAMALPEVSGALRKLGFDAVGGTPEQFAAHIRSEVERFTKLVKATGITVD
ncbi:MAG: tripartite tricarboxylate transporter substrate binding protein [Burkholderiales bacterium]|nr:tripartite tricarboxylate transporter substrate binding protein [Burkholderiales bacterium]